MAYRGGEKEEKTKHCTKRGNGKSRVDTKHHMSKKIPSGSSFIYLFILYLF